MEIPKNLKYVKTHEWVEFLDDTTARVGLTDFAQSELGSLVFVNLPEEGDEVTAGETMGDVESVKAVSDVYSPVTGRVSAVNDALESAPESINEAPYSAWLIEVSDIADREEMLTDEEYNAFCAEEGK